ncbi:MAG: hypothetical protein JSS83_15790 [Cyanobacteria bacterium SZAS LIN-3]|nr:hypothetical protein [Cyanobacteria bacterium SZAS LIN-3]
MKFAEFVEEVSQTYPNLIGLANCVNLEQGFRFLASIGYDIATMEQIPLDEFTQDLVFPISGESSYLALGVT